jgi:tRNA1Val (adenine37-N6)-methyltransferase
MANSFFNFKQFTVSQEKCAMKVGIDGVLLGAWTSINNAKNILDIGTGTGLISLMLAQRSLAEITAIDIEQSAVIQSIENILNSPWSDRIFVQKISLQDFSKLSVQKIDLIVSNPPFFINSLKTPFSDRTTARHTVLLTHEELIQNSVNILSPKGRICIILPFKEGMNCIDFAKQKSLYCSKIVFVYPKPDVPVKRVLLEFCLDQTECIESELYIETSVRHQYTTEFRRLVDEYYLK